MSAPTLRRHPAPARRTRRTRPVRRVAWACIVVGALVLSVTGGGWWWTNHHAVTQAHAAADAAEAAWGAAPADPAPDTAATPSLPSGAVAVLRIPRLGKDWRMPVYAGTGTADLRRGLGRYDGSPIPGAEGNYAVAGHRTTWGAPFRKLNTLRTGDPIVVTTARGPVTYRVVETGVTKPSDVSVIEPDPSRPELLTLTTCHPEFSARERLFVHAVPA